MEHTTETSQGAVDSDAVDKPVACKDTAGTNEDQAGHPQLLIQRTEVSAAAAGPWHGSASSQTFPTNKRCCREMLSRDSAGLSEERPQAQPANGTLKIKRQKHLHKLYIARTGLPVGRFHARSRSTLPYATRFFGPFTSQTDSTPVVTGNRMT